MLGKHWNRLHYALIRIVEDSRLLKRVDPDLLFEIVRTPHEEISSDHIESFSSVLRELKISGVYKTTGRRRLPETERALCRHFKSYPTPHINFLDVGASDGSTTLDAIEALRREPGCKIRAFLTDRHLHLLHHRFGPIAEYRTDDGEPVLVRLGGLGVIFARNPDDGLAHFYRGFNALRRRLKPAATLPLVNPLVANDQSVVIRSLDCFVREADFVGKFDAVRASNLLLHCYFSPERIATAIGHMHAYLREGGVFVSSRNEAQDDGSEIERGSLWRKNGGRFERLSDFGGGSEIRDIVDSWRAPAPGVKKASRSE